MARIASRRLSSLAALLLALGLSVAGCGSDSKPSCAQGLTACGTACVDVATDNANCGACGTACGTRQCLAGTCVTAVLVYQDSGDTGYNAAGGLLNVPIVETSAGAAFATAFDAGGFEAVIIDAPGTGLPAEIQPRLSGWVNSGGRLLFSWWQLNTNASLQTLLGVTANPSYSTFRPIHADPTSSAKLWTLRESFPTPLTGSDQAGVNGQELAVTGGDFIAARLDSATGPGAIAVTKSGRVIVNGFLPWDTRAVDGDMDGKPDMAELYANELWYVFGR